jgi:dephospho-CoA kinase
MLVIGLTGGIGTGKSEAARLLKAQGAALVGADELGHEAYRPQSRGWHQVIEAFGPEVLTSSGEVDRQTLGKIVFADPAKLEALNRIVHPIIGEAIRDQIGVLAQKGTAVVVVEAALLLEAGWDVHVDEIWVTLAAEDEAVARVVSRGRLNEEEARVRVGSQMAQEDRVKRASVVIDNNGSLEELQGRIASFWRQRTDQKP